MGSFSGLSSPESPPESAVTTKFDGCCAPAASSPKMGSFVTSLSNPPSSSRSTAAPRTRVLCSPRAAHGRTAWASPNTPPPLSQLSPLPPPLSALLRPLRPVALRSHEMFLSSSEHQSEICRETTDRVSHEVVQTASSLGFRPHPLIPKQVAEIVCAAKRTKTRETN